MTKIKKNEENLYFLSHITSIVSVYIISIHYYLIYVTFPFLSFFFLIICLLHNKIKQGATISSNKSSQYILLIFHPYTY